MIFEAAVRVCVGRADVLMWRLYVVMVQASAAGGPGKTNSVAPMSKTEHHEVVCPHIGPVNVFIQVSRC